jgi:hypothetical protein
MEAVKLVGDRIELRVDASLESTSKLFARFVRAGRFARQLGLRKMLYVREGPAADPVIVAQLIRDMPHFGLAGVRLACVVSKIDPCYPLAFVEGIAMQCDVQMRIVPSVAEAIAFLDAEVAPAFIEAEATIESLSFA